LNFAFKEKKMFGLTDYEIKLRVKHGDDTPSEKHSFSENPNPES